MNPVPALRFSNGVVVLAESGVHASLLLAAHGLGLDMDQPLESGWVDYGGFARTSRPQWPGLPSALGNPILHPKTAT